MLVPGKVVKHVPYADAYKRSQDEVRKLVPIGEELQIFICIENVWNDMLITPLEMARYIDEINSPWVGSYFDVGNCVRFGWPEHWIAALGPRIKKIDIKEFSRKLMNTKGPGAGFKLKIGEPGGDCDWPSVMAAIDAIGYHGWATAEVPGGGADAKKIFPSGWTGRCESAVAAPFVDRVALTARRPLLAVYAGCMPRCQKLHSALEE